MPASEVARIRQQIDQEVAACKLAMNGYAAVANHSSITARMERGADRLLALFAEGKHEEAMRLWETTDWALGEVTSCPITTEESIQGERAAKGTSSL